MWSQMSFSAAEENFHAGARGGIDARLYWPGLGEVPAAELVLRRLLPLAHEGLERWGVDFGRRRAVARHHRAPLRDRPERRVLAGRRHPGHQRAAGPAARRRCGR